MLPGNPTWAFASSSVGRAAEKPAIASTELFAARLKAPWAHRFTGWCPGRRLFRPNASLFARAACRRVPRRGVVIQPAWRSGQPAMRRNRHPPNQRCPRNDPGTSAPHASGPTALLPVGRPAARPRRRTRSRFLRARALRKIPGRHSRGKRGHADFPRNPSDPLSAKFHDLRLLYEKYTQYLGQDRLDQHQRLKQVIDCIAAWPALKNASIYVDGFLDFAEQERRLLGALAKGCSSLEITLLMDPASLVCDPTRRPSR